MHIRCTLTAIVMLLLVLLAGCGKVAPTAIPMPPTDVPILSSATDASPPDAPLSPTATVPLPTDAPPSPTATEPPPTDTPVPALPKAQDDARIRGADEMTMLLVPGGTFSMGSTDAEVQNALARCREAYRYCNLDFYGREAPQHTVTLDSFWIDQTEVTNAQFQLCVEAGVCEAPIMCAEGKPTFDDGSKADHPVVCVAWHDAQTYCEWAGARLPTEAEWEYAARGPDGSLYPWGDERGGPWQNFCDASCGEAWADGAMEDGHAKTSPIDSYPEGASWCGALDMAGNAYEWVADWMGGYTSEPQINPTGPPTGTERVLRSSSWVSFWDRARGATRDWVDPKSRYDHIGFRCAGGADKPELEASPSNQAPLVLVPEGEFEMGSDVSDNLANEDEFPRHSVSLSGFWIDRTEVTNTQYTRCVVEGACRKSNYAQNSKYNGDDYPAVGVSWQDAVDYCAWSGGRLPTEAEWEYAARGPKGFIYPWGNEFDGTRLNYCDANCELYWADPAMDDGYAENAPVGSYPEGASWCGALDMAGNVWEWVADWAAGYPSMPQSDPTGPDTGTHRVLRGGCWANEPNGVRTAYRLSSGDATPNVRHANIGFRCVRDKDPG